MSAIISSCGEYRYRLERDVQMGGKIIAYFGINPSTADATQNDATIRKMIGFTKINGGSSFIVGNVFAFRATNVKELSSVADPIGKDNGSRLFDIIEDADILVPCWGSRSKVPAGLHEYIDCLGEWLLASAKPVMCFGRTASGDPKHPLMLGYATPLVPFVGGGV